MLVSMMAKIGDLVTANLESVNVRATSLLSRRQRD